MYKYLKKKCEGVTRYREEEREERSKERVKTTFKIGPHYGRPDIACLSGKRKIISRLENKCYGELSWTRTHCNPYHCCPINFHSNED